MSNFQEVDRPDAIEKSDCCDGYISQERFGDEVVQLLHGLSPMSGNNKEM